MLANEDFCALLETAQASVMESILSFAESHREALGEHVLLMSVMSSRLSNSV